MQPTSKIIELHQPCPECNSSDAYCVWDDGHGYCFSCKYYKPKKELDLNDYTYEYINWRGIGVESFRHYAVRCKCGPDGRPESIGFNYPDGSVKVRRMDQKDFRWVGETRPGVFGLDRFAVGAHKSIIITEGELDAISLWQSTRTPSVSVRSAGSAASDVSAVRSRINDYERIYLAFDNDPAGDRATAEVARLFDYNKVFHIKFTNRKDANEYLAAGENTELLNLYHNARRYLPSTIVSSLDDFEKALTVPKAQGVPYPWPTLTKMTYGIRLGEVVLLKAPEKVGKTAIMHHIEHHLLKETDANVGAIYIEEPRERHLQCIAGLELKSPAHLPDSSVTSDQMVGAIRKLVGKDDRLFIYNHFGTSDPDVILDTVRFLVTSCGVRYVLFDHISMAVTGLSGEKDERRALEYLATRLEMMVKELNFSLIMVTHVNDLGQSRGSHYLTKLADITINCERQTLGVDEKDKRTITLSVPYNRFCSHTGIAGKLVFDPDTYVLTEERYDVRREDTPWQTQSHGNTGVGVFA